MEAGSRIGPWVIDVELGRGGMGSVFSCHHHAAKRMKRALKVLDPGAMPNAQKRFVREAEILFELNHPAVVDVVDLALDHDPPYLVMELIEGESLDQLMKQGPIPIGDATRMFSSLASGLQHAHKQGVRHRDIKPANIMISGGMPKLVDFGIAVHEERTRLTKAGMKFGSMSYTPPELFEHPDIDNELRDVYALGVVLFEALTGRPAFPEPKGVPMHVGWAQLQVKKAKGGPLDPGPRIPRAMRSLVQGATHPDPSKRVRNMGEFLERLDGVYASSAADSEQVVMLTTDEITNNIQMPAHMRHQLRSEQRSTSRAAVDTYDPDEVPARSSARTVAMVLGGLAAVLIILGVSGLIGALGAWLVLG